MRDPERKSNVSKIVVGTVLCSLSAAAIQAYIRQILEANKNHPPDNLEQNAKKTDSTSNADTAEAIAAPENLPVNQLAKLAFSPELLNPELDATLLAKTPITVRSRQASNFQQYYRQVPAPGQWSSPSSDAIAPPETMSSVLAELAAIDREDKIPAIQLTVSLNDIQGHWAQYYIEYLASRYIVRGFPDGRFRPDQPITAAEFNTMLQRASQDAVVPQHTSFFSISFGQLQALKPGQSVTRAEASAFIYRALVRSEPAQLVTNVQISGEVSRPGRYSLAAASDERLGQGNNLPTLSRAIQQAGGALSSADLRQVEIHRRTDTGTTKVIRVDVWKTLRSGSLAQDVVVQQNDRIVIPASATRTQPDRGNDTAYRQNSPLRPAALQGEKPQPRNLEIRENPGSISLPRTRTLQENPTSTPINPSLQPESLTPEQDNPEKELPPASPSLVPVGRDRNPELRVMNPSASPTPPPLGEVGLRVPSGE
ncbi:S-layer homology domain-containing protein [Leptothermofonsia sp. ETS-13]|uniref:S-layer homology domain-containing protein n=1 Tax=Leptothermofonsia sp. ETS-13 TaxID=3035696 RepID=UPI003BA1947B